MSLSQAFDVQFERSVSAFERPARGWRDAERVLVSWAIRGGKWCIITAIPSALAATVPIVEP
jgi:hypothetical protein